MSRAVAACLYESHGRQKTKKASLDSVALGDGKQPLSSVQPLARDGRSHTRYIFWRCHCPTSATRCPCHSRTYCSKVWSLNLNRFCIYGIESLESSSNQMRCASWGVPQNYHYEYVPPRQTNDAPTSIDTSFRRSTVTAHSFCFIYLRRAPKICCRNPTERFVAEYTTSACR